MAGRFSPEKPAAAAGVIGPGMGRQSVMLPPAAASIPPVTIVRAGLLRLMGTWDELPGWHSAPGRAPFRPAGRTERPVDLVERAGRLL